METKDPKDQIGNNQLANTEDTQSTPNNQASSVVGEDAGAINPSKDDEKEDPTSEMKDLAATDNQSADTQGESQDTEGEEEGTDSNTPKPEPVEEEQEQSDKQEITANNDAQDEPSDQASTSDNDAQDEPNDQDSKSDKDAQDEPNEQASTSDKDAQDEPNDQASTSDKENSDEPKASGTKDQEKGSETLDYQTLSREELVDRLRDLLKEKHVHKIRTDVDIIKINFYKKHKLEFERKRKEWVESGGDIDAFETPDDIMEPQIKELLKQYRELKSDHNRTLEDQKVKNLEEKQSIIEQIKDLVNRNESVNQTFQEFRELQHKWRDVGPVPQANLNDLWETYHHHVQNFYDYIKINKELRDLDLKKNLEEKIILCEKAEELLLEQSIVNAFKKLQILHNQWREIGPVPNENRSEIWERFKEATTKINRKHQEHFEKIKEEQKANLKAKVALCEKAEEIMSLSLSTNKEWNKRSKEMIELQKVWKTIGFAPKKDNNKIYERFRTACDTFFNNKREFYEETHEEQHNNLQLKTELCMQADALKDSTEWKKTSDELINLQKRWKEIGPVPRKHSEDIWKRFRTACDQFFQQRSAHFTQTDSNYMENLKAKEALIEKIENYTVSENLEENLKSLKGFQRNWAEIGFVPIKKKDEIQKRYREAINKHFDHLNVDDAKKKVLRFKTKIDTVQGNPRQENKLRNERERLFNQLKHLENDIALWENNIGFFSKSKNAEQLIKDVEHKIAKGRKEMKVLEEKIRMIDDMN